MEHSPDMAKTTKTATAPAGDAVETDHVDRFLATLELPGVDLTVEGIVDRIMGISRRLRRSMDDTLSAFELTWGEWTVLGTLRHEPSRRASPGELAKKHELSSGAMTNRLDRLEEAGLIVRVPNADDRRGIVVEITEEGMRVWHESVGVQAEKEALVTAAALDSHEREELNGFLRRLMLSFERSEGAEGKAGYKPGVS
jgi:DNA-binding MarR family transcriptional regulator